VLTVEERSFLDQMRLKHLPGLHDQSTHGHGVRDALMAARHVGDLAQAAKKEAKRITGRDISFRFTGTGLAVAQEHAEGILTGLERFPRAPLSAVTTFGPGGAESVTDSPKWTGSYALHVAGKVWFNTGHSGDERSYRESLRRADDVRWLTNSKPTGVALHEFGHVLDFYADAKERIRAHMKQPGVGPKAMSALARDGVSVLAATDFGELAAEAFADVMVNGNLASPLSKELFAVIEDAYRTRVRR
jgi:hypothetical protein